MDTDKLLFRLTHFAVIVGFCILALFLVCLWLLGLVFFALIAVLFEYWLGIPEGQGSWIGLILGTLYMVGTIWFFAHMKERARKIDRETFFARREAHEASKADRDEAGL